MSTFVTQYQSANLSNEQAIDNFVVRTKEFERIMADIRSTPKGTSFQHYVFVGRRGSGKSTLLRRIQAEIQTDEELNKLFIVTNLGEEQAGIYKLYDLWDYVIRDLKAKGFEVPEFNWEDYQDDLKQYSKALYEQIHTSLDKDGRQLVLLVDNIDRIFKNIGKDASLLREQLMNHNDVRIIGGSTIMAEDFWRYDMPFYQFFSVKRLEALSMEEIKELLERWAKVKANPEISRFAEQHPGKIQVVRMLTDGTPRTMQLFVDMLVQRDDQQGYEYLRHIIDNATPIYQERLGQLSHQQQKIVVELSFFWEAASIEQLVPVCKMTSKNISAQMSQLVKARIVEKIKGEKKNYYYRLEERFFNLWLLMTQGGPQQKREAKYLTVFLEAWYEPEELREVYAEICSKLAKGGVKQDYAISIAKALSHSKHLNWKQRDNLLDRVSEQFPGSMFGDMHLPEKALQIFEKATKVGIKEGWDEGTKMMNTIEQLDLTLITLYIAIVSNKRGELYDFVKPLSDPQLFNASIWIESGFLWANLFLANYTKWHEVFEPFVEGIIVHSLGSEQLPQMLLPIMVWAGKMDKFEEFWLKAQSKFSQMDGNAISTTFMSLLIHKQYNKLLEVFNSDEYGNHLKEVAKPQYYAMLTLMGRHESVLDRMPPELAQLVQDLVAHIRTQQTFHYG